MKTKNSVVCAEFTIGSKSLFLKGKFQFSQFVFVDKYLKSRNYKYVNYYDIDYVIFETWPGS